MLSLILILLLALIPIPVIYLFYHQYFIVKPSHLYHLEYFIYGVVLALLILLANQSMLGYLQFTSTAGIGFLNAALIEKTGAVIVIVALMYRAPSIIMVLNMVISAMLLGLGFATVENIMYALTVREPVIIVRLFSSVPLHVLTCGLIGYYLALFRLSGSRLNRTAYAVKALAIPFLFHGMYDTLLIAGGVATYWIAPLLIVLIIGMEYILAKSQTLPLLDGLLKHNIFIEDWVTFQREPQHERWILRSMGSRNREYVPLFRLSLERIRTAVIILLLVVAAVSLAGRDVLIEALRNRLSLQEAVMLFTLLPALYSLNLFIIGVVNPKYFQNSMIKIPIITDANITADGTYINAITYHVTSGNCYLKTVDPLEPGTRLVIAFTCSAFSSPRIPAVVVWDSHDEQKQLSGTLVRFSSRPIRFWLFLVRYYLYRVTRGLSFNLRLPGFRSVRQLFVRPVSVMQKEWRYSAGRKLFEQGEAAKYFYLVRKGEVDIIKTLETGEKVLMTTLKEGDIFGEMAIVGDQPRLASAVCRTDCLLAVAEADNLEALINGNPVFTQKLIKTFANRLRDSEQIMLKNMAAIDGASKRREETLLTLCKLLFLISGLERGGNAAVGSADAAALAARLKMDHQRIANLIDSLIDIKDVSRLDDLIESLLKES